MVRALSGCFLGFLFFSATCGVAAAAHPIDVYVGFRGRDQIGTDVAYQVKEDIKKSEEFHLSYSWKNSEFMISIISVDDNIDGQKGVTSSIGYSFVKTRGDLYLNTGVSDCGADRISFCALGIVSDLSETAQPFLSGG